MNIRRITRGPGTQAAVGVITTVALGFMGGLFLADRQVVAYVLFAAAAFRLFAVVRDLRRARARARE
jgi:hypothetical protein